MNRYATPVFGAFLAVFIMSAACSSKTDDGRRRAARILYEKQLEIIGAYTDSIINLPDTVDETPTLSHFSEKMTLLNLHYPYQIDVHLTEGENDSLYYATQRLLAAARKRHEAKPDSIVAPADSIASEQKRDSVGGK